MRTIFPFIQNRKTEAADSAVSVFSGFLNELLAAFGAADIDAPFSARDTDDLPTARTGEIPVLPVAKSREKALEGSVSRRRASMLRE